MRNNETESVANVPVEVKHLYGNVFNVYHSGYTIGTVERLGNLNHWSFSLEDKGLGDDSDDYAFPSQEMAINAMVSTYISKLRLNKLLDIA